MSSRRNGKRGNAWDAKHRRWESAALFIVGSSLRVRVGSVFLVVGNQERAAAGLDNPIAHDTELAVRTAVEALRKLIRADREKQMSE